LDPPGNRARVFVVSDRPLREVHPRTGMRASAPGAVQRPIQAWAARTSSVADPGKNAFAHRHRRPPAIAAIGHLCRRGAAAVRGSDDTLALNAANEVLGSSSFLSRINTEIRERRGWSYGLSGNVQPARAAQVPYVINAPVQADRTGDSIRVLARADQRLQRDQRRDRRLSTRAHHQRQHPSVARRVRDRRDRCSARCARTQLYQPALTITGKASPPAIAAMSAAQMDAAARAVVDPSQALCGSSSAMPPVVRPQVEALGLPVEVVTP
jgi:zinc protease